MSGTRALRPHSVVAASVTKHPLRRLARLAAPLTALAVLAAPAAYADTWTHADARGDVLVSDYYLNKPGTPRVVDPNEHRVDVTRLTVDATSDRVQVALTMGRSPNVGATFKIATSKGDTFHVLYQSTYDPSFQVRRNSYVYTCDGVRVVRTRAGLVLRFPHPCLGSPYRVQVGAQVYTYAPGPYDDNGQSERVAQDDAYRTGRYMQHHPKLGPWVVASHAS